MQQLSPLSSRMLQPLGPSPSYSNAAGRRAAAATVVRRSVTRTGPTQSVHHQQQQQQHQHQQQQQQQPEDDAYSDTISGSLAATESYEMSFDSAGGTSDAGSHDGAGHSARPTLPLQRPARAGQRIDGASSIKSRPPQIQRLGPQTEVLNFENEGAISASAGSSREASFVSVSLASSAEGSIALGGGSRSDGSGAKHNASRRAAAAPSPPPPPDVTTQPVPLHQGSFEASQRGVHGNDGAAAAAAAFAATELLHSQLAAVCLPNESSTASSGRSSSRSGSSSSKRGSSRPGSGASSAKSTSPLSISRVDSSGVGQQQLVQAAALAADALTPKASVAADGGRTMRPGSPPPPAPPPPPQQQQQQTQQQQAQPQTQVATDVSRADSPAAGQELQQQEPRGQEVQQQGQSRQRAASSAGSVQADCLGDGSGLQACRPCCCCRCVRRCTPPSDAAWGSVGGNGEKLWARLNAVLHQAEAGLALFSVEALLRRLQDAAAAAGQGPASAAPPPPPPPPAQPAQPAPVARTAAAATLAPLSAPCTAFARPLVRDVCTDTADALLAAPTPSTDDAAARDANARLSWCVAVHSPFDVEADARVAVARAAVQTGVAQLSHVLTQADARLAAVQAGRLALPCR